MTGRWRNSAIGVLAAAAMLAFGVSPSRAEPSRTAHVYLLRGLMNIFSLGMDTLGAELSRHGIATTVDNHADWQSLADGAAARYKAGTEGPIILIGHSLGADAVMEMAAYLGRRGVPVALVVPFDGTQSFAASSNVARVVNLTQRDYAYMRGGPGFHGSLINVDVSSDHSIDHITIDKSPRLHARVISEVLSIVGGGGGGHHAAPTATSVSVGNAKPAEPGAIPSAPSPAPAKNDGASNAAPVIAAPERPSTHAASEAPAAPHN
jgi:Thioesterase domain